MVKTSLFAADEREARLNKLGDILQDLDEQIDFVRLAAEVDKAVPRPCRNKGGRTTAVPLISHITAKSLERYLSVRVQVV